MVAGVDVATPDGGSPLLAALKGRHVSPSFACQLISAAHLWCVLSGLAHRVLAYLLSAVRAHGITWAGPDMQVCMVVP